MCGISGIFQYGTDEPVCENVLARMLRAISHRGPDDQGLYCEANLAIGMRRLSIIDPAGGKQPMLTEDGRVVVVANGEIYNYQDLGAQLRRSGHALHTKSDTEVIGHLYEEVGSDLVHHLRGMFALAVWDRGARRLLLARDRLGIKPLYYLDTGTRLIFGSEIKAILRHPAVDARPNLEAVSRFLSLKYVPAPDTLFAGIRSLPPGHVLVCDRRGVTVRQYWDLSFANEGTARVSEAEYAEELLGRLREAVKLHLRSDVPFGAFLSGGIDSSLIVALMSEQLTEPVKTFSVGFERVGERTDELPFARQVASQYATEHREVVIRPQDFTRRIESVIWHLDQPIADQASLAVQMVSELAAGHVKMVLTGEGADELFAGYARYAGERLSPLFEGMSLHTRSLLVRLSQLVPGLTRPKIALRALCQPDALSRLTNWFPLFDYQQKQMLLSKDFAHSLPAVSANDVVGACLSRTDARSALNRMLYLDTKLWLPDFLLLRGDKLSMAASLEARVPFLDHHLVEFAASLPTGLKLRRLTRKYVLRTVARGLVPQSVIARRKEGFPMPIGQWFRHEARPLIRDLLSPAVVRRRGLFDEQYVERLLREHETGQTSHAYLLLGLLSLELWFRAFIDPAAAAASA